MKTSSSLLQTLVEHTRGKPSSRVLGIDLGTTNSTVAEIALPLKPDVTAEHACNDLSIEQVTLSGPTYSTLVPSVVALDNSGTEWVGEGAKRLRADAVAHGFSPERNLFSDTKNDMGLRKRYHRAPEDYDHARKIAARVLKFLSTAARRAAGTPVTRMVVTVPASFQVNQRTDTLWAASEAGLGISDEDLLDEPVAALVDFLFTYAEEGLFAKPANLVVFDFGGGTCDVFVCRIEPRAEAAGLSIVARSVSRYHRLGGYDLDAAIIHEHLIPRLLKENELSQREFGWGERKRIVEPALRSCAEALKEGLCREIAQLELHGRYADADKTQVVARMIATNVRVGKKDYLLRDATLSAAEWESLLKPFLDKQLLHVRESDYRQELSIFTPIEDALTRAAMKPSVIDYVLLAGGSSLIPQVQQALRAYFKTARLLTFPDSTAAQTAIARGAAWSAAWLEATGTSFVQRMVGEALALRVEGRDPVTLIPAGSPIPFPDSEDWKQLAGLAVPRSFNGTLKVELVTLPEERVVLHYVIRLPKERSGAALIFQYRLSAARRLETRVGFLDTPDEHYEVEAENPLVNIASPGEAREEIEQIEEELRDAGGLAPHHRQRLLRLAQLYRELRMLEKSAEVLKSLTLVLKTPDIDVLNLRGIVFEEMGDFNLMEACYREAAQLAEDAAPLFNWALHCYRQRRPDDGLAKIDVALQRETEGAPYHALRGLILGQLDRKEAAIEAANNAIRLARPLSEQTGWELCWHESALRFLNKTDDLKATRAERDRRSAGRPAAVSEGQPPAFNSK